MKIQVDDKTVKFENNCVKVFDSQNNCIHYKGLKGFEHWDDYDKNNNKVHHTDNDGFEIWYEYGETNNCIHSKDSKGFEYWYNITEDVITKEEFEELYELKSMYVLRK